MEGAFENVFPAVRKGGVLFISIYNDQGRKSIWWRKIKKAYTHTPRIFRFIFIVPFIMRYWAPTMLKDAIRHGNPFYYFKIKERGMSVVYDMYDWLGGYPFEVATPGSIFNYFYQKGFELIKMTTKDGSGCNQYVFLKK
jgi:2-polyprenyl-6-hydroxyphenyl methylase/3-demethylubiquinone-9 3-methyltransferase